MMVLGSRVTPFTMVIFGYVKFLGMLRNLSKIRGLNFFKSEVWKLLGGETGKMRGAVMGSRTWSQGVDMERLYKDQLMSTFNGLAP